MCLFKAAENHIYINKFIRIWIKKDLIAKKMIELMMLLLYKMMIIRKYASVSTN